MQSQGTPKVWAAGTIGGFRALKYSSSRESEGSPVLAFYEALIDVWV